jgi:hypothetical protein
MKKLFLDDVRLPHHCVVYKKESVYLDSDWDIVRSYEEFKDYIQLNGLPDLISFDHDLADEHYNPLMYTDGGYNDLYKDFKEKTGLDCAKWLVDYLIDNKMSMCSFLIHSMNPAGGSNISSYLNNFIKSLG